MVTPRVSTTSLDDPDLRRLIEQLNEELRTRYPEEGATHFRLDPAEVAPGVGGVVIARAGEVPVGCGAVRLLDRETAEIKRMYTAPAARRTGVASLILTELESIARSLGARRLVLETGTRQTAAIALYRRLGFADIERFGEYADSPLSLCMSRPLLPGDQNAFSSRSERP